MMVAGLVVDSLQRSKTLDVCVVVASPKVGWHVAKDPTSRRSTAIGPDVWLPRQRDERTLLARLNL